MSRRSLLASPRWDALELPSSRGARGARCRRIASRRRPPPQRRRRRARRRRWQRDRPRQGDLCRDRAAARLGADDVRRSRVDDLFRRPRPAAANAGRRRRRATGRDRLRARADAGPAHGDDRGHGDERARPLRRGAVRAGTQSRRRRARAGRRAARLRLAAAHRRRPEPPRGAHGAAPRRLPRRRRARRVDARPRARAWRRRSAAATGSRTGRSTGSACRPRFASTPPTPRRPSGGSAKRSALAILPAASRSSRRWRTRRGWASSACVEDDLRALAAAAAQRGGNLANPRPASPDEIEQMLRSIY